MATGKARGSRGECKKAAKVEIKEVCVTETKMTISVAMACDCTSNNDEDIASKAKIEDDNKDGTSGKLVPGQVSLSPQVGATAAVIASSSTRGAAIASPFAGSSASAMIRMNASIKLHRSNRAAYLVTPNEILQQPVTTFFVMEVDKSKNNVFAKSMRRYLTEGGRQKGCVSVTCFLPLKSSSPSRATNTSDDDDNDDKARKRLKNSDSSDSSGDTLSNNKKRKASSLSGSPLSSNGNDICSNATIPSDSSSCSRYFTLLIRARYASFEHFTTAISASYSAPAMDHLLRDALIRKFPIMTMWHKVNPLYEAKFAHVDEELRQRGGNTVSASNCEAATLSTASLSPSLSMTISASTPTASSSDRRPGRSTYFMMRTRRVKRFVDKEFVVEILCRLALQARNGSNITNFVNICDGSSQYNFYHRSNSSCNYCAPKDASRTKEESSSLATAPTTYDVLVSNDILDRHNEIMEWASWTSYEAYQRYLQQDFVQYYEQVANSLCVASSTSATTNAEQEPPHPLHHAWKRDGNASRNITLASGSTTSSSSMENTAVTTSFWKRAPEIKPDLTAL